MNDILKRLSVIYGVILGAWILSVAFIIDFAYCAFYGWAGLCGSVLTFLVAGVSILLWKQDSRRDTTEINGIVYVITGGYFVVALIANTVFCALASWNNPKFVPIVVNALILIVFLGARMFIAPYRNRVAETAAYTANKVYHVGELSSRLGELLAMAQNETVKKRLRCLKETLDYSTNTSQPFAEETEELFWNQLNDIYEAIAQDGPVEDVLSRIAAAEKTWQKRNGASAAR